MLAGPTAVGKSAIAVALAEEIGGEIVSVDSMQVYRGLDLGTAKPTTAERARVPHHLIDVVDLTASFDAGQFVCLAGAAVAAIQGRGRIPILCGGTGLYLQAWLAGLGKVPASPPQLRVELEATPLPVLIEELSARDPVAFQQIDHRNVRRVRRAIEVIRLTGRPFSSQRADWRGTASRDPAREAEVVVFTRASEDLRQRIEARVDLMFASGLVEEARRLLGAGLATNRTALQALGYRQVVDHLQGQRSLAETVALVKQKTWRYARRQLTWFRHQMQGRWIELGAGDSPAQVARNLRVSVDDR